MTGPAWKMACSMVVVVRGNSGVTGAGVCARSDDVPAGASKSQKKFFMP